MPAGAGLVAGVEDSMLAVEAALTSRAAADAPILPEEADAITAADALLAVRIRAIPSQVGPEADPLPDARDVRPIRSPGAQAIPSQVGPAIPAMAAAILIIPGEDLPMAPPPEPRRRVRITGAATTTRVATTTLTAIGSARSRIPTITIDRHDRQSEVGYGRNQQTISRESSRKAAPG
jgi:hypothetical protein